MEDRALTWTKLVILALCAISVAGGVLAGFVRGRTALGIILSVGVPIVLISPLSALRKFEADETKRRTHPDHDEEE